MSTEDDGTNFSDTDPSRHLVRAGDEQPQTLGQLTGLARMRLDTHDLAADSIVELPGGRERFIYVLEGSGEVTAASSAMQAIESGDVIALGDDESARVVASPIGLTFLLGAGPRDSSAD